MAQDCVVVYVTCPTLALAEEIGETIVREKLAACVNLIPQVHSIYTWEGAVQKESETLMVIKTLAEKLEILEKRIKSLHSYSIPEFVSLPILEGSKDYLDWIREIRD